jgi:hypothetical protein
MNKTRPGKKGDLKLLEHAAIGLPVIASNAGPYASQTDLASRSAG